MKKTAILCNNPTTIDWVYGMGRREKLAELSALYPTVVTSDALERHPRVLHDVEALFSTWGMPELGEEQLDRMPALRAVFYAAGSVKRFGEPLLRRGIVLTSAWGANGIPVAEYTVAQIILANKGFFPNARACSESAEHRAKAFRGMKGNFGETVAILGAGMIGRHVIQLLKAYTLKVVAWDPFLPREQADALGVEKVDTLEEAFARGLVVTNHLANVPGTRGLLTGNLFALMRPDATFINTGRGATVVETEMIEVLGRRPDLTALLDVTDPEPPVAGSPLYELDNVTLTAHIAGSIGDEVVRMADHAIEEFLAWEQGRPLRYAVTAEMLATMA